ncbi:hypothetical protein HK104_008683 [Borealophlyctis nickersoniae]|nr:hypothetical protein HK104_008683 [Borealophlyctis nickersoniae]
MSANISHAEATRLAENWISAWNARDLEGIMGHYAANVRFTSPRVAAAPAGVGDPSGTLYGSDRLRRYFSAAMGSLPPGPLMELISVGVGVGGEVAVVYKRETGTVVVECMEVAGGKVACVRVMYSAGAM